MIQFISPAAGQAIKEGYDIRAVPYVLEGEIVGFEFIKIEGLKSKGLLKDLETGKIKMGSKSRINVKGKKVLFYECWPAKWYKTGKTERGWLVIQS